MELPIYMWVAFILAALFALSNLILNVLVYITFLQKIFEDPVPKKLIFVRSYMPDGSLLYSKVQDSMEDAVHYIRNHEVSAAYTHVVESDGMLLRYETGWKRPERNNEI